MKKALITGITGQDGAYLAQLLLEKGYEVHGIKRRSSSFNTGRIDSLFKDPLQFPSSRLMLHYGDLADASNLTEIVRKVAPDEVYNLAAMSHVGVSFLQPEYTANTTGVGTVRLLEAIRVCGLAEKTKFYQASTSELYGKVQEIPQTEKTPFYPRSPYGVAKLYAYWSTVNYREAYGMFASNGILFNHESPLRGETFVTRKITMAAAAIRANLQKFLFLGNLDAKRDWGYAKESVEGMWQILQLDKPDDFVMATGETRTVREFATLAFEIAGIPIEWSGTPGTVDEVGICKKTGNTLIKVHPQYFRPSEVDLLVGDCTKLRERTGWKPKTNFEELCRIMVESDINLLEEKRVHQPRNFEHPFEDESYIR